MPAVADMQNSIIKEFEANPCVVTAIYNEGGDRGETREWLETVWDNYYLRGSIIWDATGNISRQAYDQPDTGLPFGRSFIIDRGGDVVLPYFGHDAARAIKTIYGLLDPVEVLTVTTEISGCQATFAADVTGTIPYSYHWDFGLFGTSAEPQPMVDFGISGSFPYTLTVSNACVADSYTGMVAVDCPNSKIFLPLILKDD
jgi:hypothetical protein